MQLHRSCCGLAGTLLGWQQHLRQQCLEVSHPILALVDAVCMLSFQHQKYCTEHCSSCNVHWNAQLNPSGRLYSTLLASLSIDVGPTLLLYLIGALQAHLKRKYYQRKGPHLITKKHTIQAEAFKHQAGSPPGCSISKVPPFRLSADLLGMRRQ